MRKAARSSLFQRRIRRMVKRRGSQRKGIVATTGPCSEKVGGDTITSETWQSSRVTTTSSQPPATCVDSVTCCLRPNCSRTATNSTVSGSDESSRWKIEVSNEYQLCVVQCELIHSFIHSFILNIYIAPLQKNYSEALPTPARSNKAVLR